MLIQCCSGLGIGTTPSAFVAHGINTTVVELDPAVHDFATKYFDYNQNNPPVLQDAVQYTGSLSRQSNQVFDYIVHDVFTGGAEPVDLFTLEFLQGLGDLLKPEGVIAVVSLLCIHWWWWFVHIDCYLVELCGRLYSSRSSNDCTHH